MLTAYRLAKSPPPELCYGLLLDPSPHLLAPTDDQVPPPVWLASTRRRQAPPPARPRRSRVICATPRRPRMEIRPVGSGPRQYPAAAASGPFQDSVAAEDVHEPARPSIAGPV